MTTIGWFAFGLRTNLAALHTFTFQTLFYFALCSVLSIRERRWFWASAPSPALGGVLLLDAGLGTLLSSVGIPGLTPLPWPMTLTALAASIVLALGVNDVVKMGLVACLRRADPR